MTPPQGGGRNWADVQRLYHPTSCSNLAALPARIAEWKSLEQRCTARTGEVIPNTLRNLALINLCPEFLQKRLYDQPEVATGRIAFAELENLIMLAVHRPPQKTGVNAVETDESSEPVEFEIAGELFRLELKDGRRVPVKQGSARPPQKKTTTFKGKCYRCDRTGHRKSD